MNKKIISLLLVGSMSISMVGCKGHFRFDKFSKKNKNTQTETNIGNNDNNQFNWNNNNQFNTNTSEVNRAYEYYKSEFTKYEDNEKKYEYDTTGIGFTQYVTDVRIISKGNEQGMADFLALEYKEATNNKKVMDSNGFTTVDYFYKISYNGQVVIEIRNGNLITFDTGDEEFKNNVLAMVSQGSDRTTSDKGNNTLKNDNTKNETEKTYTCKECGKKYKKKNSDAIESTKYCSSECYTEARMEKRNKDAKTTTKTYYCKDCGTKISKSQYNNWKRCPSCARTHDKEQKKEYICKYCGKGYTSDEAKANRAPSGFCSEICAVNWEGQQHENWEAHHGYDSNGRLIPCKDRCGDGCE